MTKIIGMQLSQDRRQILWHDMRESKTLARAYRHSSDEAEARIAALDQDLFSRKLSEYAVA